MGAERAITRGMRRRFGRLAPALGACGHTAARTYTLRMAAVIRVGGVSEMVIMTSRSPRDASHRWRAQGS
jgi:hypothetical protein